MRRRMKVESSFWPETSSLFELSVSAPSQMSCRVWLEHFFQPSAAYFFFLSLSCELAANE